MNLLSKLMSTARTLLNAKQDTAARVGLLSAAMLMVVGVGYTAKPALPVGMVTTKAGFVGPFGRPQAAKRLSVALATYKTKPRHEPAAASTASKRRPEVTTPNVPMAKKQERAETARREIESSLASPERAPAKAKPKTAPPKPEGPGPLRNAQNIDPLLLQRFKAFRNYIWKKYGVTLSIRSGYRSTEEQARLYRTLPAGQANPPGTSQHEKGNAIDYAPFTPEFNQHLARYGMKLPFGWKEQWHVEIVEPH